MNKAIDTPLGHCCKVRHHDRKKIERKTNSLAMEISTTPGFAICENERVVSCGVDLSRHHRVNPVERILDRTVYLRHAAQTVWILNSGIPITMGFPDLAVSEELAKKAGRSGLSGLAASLMDAVIERYRRAHQRIERH